jgi:hypothetical protein
LPKSFQRKAFDRWLSRNQGLFQRPPVIVENRKKYFNMRFRRINAAIDCTITSHGYAISVSHEGGVWDLIDDRELSERRTSSGHYFCELCKPECRELFPTRSALWEDHIFKQLLNWENNNLLKTKWVCLFQYGQGVTMAQVVDEKSLLMVMQDDSFVKAIPMVVHQVMPIQKSDTLGNKSSDAALRHVLAFKELVSSLKTR